jgi:hypothetical protein
VSQPNPRLARPESAIDRLRACIDDDAAIALVTAYFDPSSGFAGATFDTLGTSRPNEFDAHDLLALNLLDERLSSTAIRWLLSTEGTDVMRPLLEAIGSDAELGAPGDSEALASAEAAYSRLTSLGGVGSTKATKLLARKRPALVPILDTVVRSVVMAPQGQYWATFQAFMGEKRHRARLEQVKRRAGIPDEITLLRVLDVAIWMGGSGSRAAWRVRDDLDVPDLAWTPRARSRQAI